MNQPLWIGISVDGTQEMQPLTRLAAVPYALNIPDQSVTMAKLSPEVAAGIGQRKTPTIQTANGTVYWGETGNNSTIPGTNYVGTSDSVALELHVYDGDATANRGSKRIMRYEPNALSPNIIGGYQGNKMRANTVGSVIDGGGTNGGINEIRSNYSVIVSGTGGLIDSNSKEDAILTGIDDYIGRGAPYCLIGAGNADSIHDGALGSVILGGSTNKIIDSCSDGFIGAGTNNTILNKAKSAVTLGGDSLVASCYGQTVFGYYNIAQGTSSPTNLVDSDDILIVGKGIAGNRDDAFQISRKGHTIVHDSNGYTHPAITGGTYMDNIVYAWGYVSAGHHPIAEHSFGVSSISYVGNSCAIELNLSKPNNSVTSLNYSDAAIIITPYDNSDPCIHYEITGLMIDANGRTTFNVVFYQTVLNPASPPSHPLPYLDCQAVAVSPSFMFIVVGRPHG